MGGYIGIVNGQTTKCLLMKTTPWFIKQMDDWRNLPRQLRIRAAAIEEAKYPKPTFDYWDRLAEIKEEMEDDNIEWFHASH